MTTLLQLNVILFSCHKAVDWSKAKAELSHAQVWQVPSLKSHKNHEQDSPEWLGALQSSNDFGSLVRLKPSHLLLFPHLSSSIEPPHPLPEIAHLTLAWWICRKTRWYNKFHEWTKHWHEGPRRWQKGDAYSSGGRINVQPFATGSSSDRPNDVSEALSWILVFHLQKWHFSRGIYSLVEKCGSFKDFCSECANIYRCIDIWDIDLCIGV